MRVLIVDVIRRHVNPNPDIIQSVIEGFRQASPTGTVRVATRWDLEAVAKAQRPHLIVALSSRIWDELVAPLCTLRRRLPATVGWWLTDDPYEIDCNLKQARLWDFIASNDRASMPLYSGTSVFHLPLAADRQRHFRPVRTDDAAYQRDVFFCGVGFPNRRGLIEAAAPILSRHKTLIVGPDWPPLGFTSAERIDNTDLADYYNSSRIVLNLPRTWNLWNRCQFPASTPAPRTFEAAAAGGFQLAPADRPELHRFFDVPGEFDLFLDVAELERKIGWYLAHPAERIRAALQAQQRALEQHTYSHRAAALLRHVRLLGGQPAHQDAEASPSTAPAYAA
jgi:spore maturation protein CgeB